MNRGQMKIMQMVEVAREGRMNKGQMKIMQMAFMIVAVMFFFVLVGLFFLGIQLGDIQGSAASLQRDKAISSLKVIADMPELNYDSSESMTLDEDKLRIMSGGFSSAYEMFWPVASVKVYQVYPAFNEVKKCPGLGCNYYEIYDSGQTDVKEYSSYVSICKNLKELDGEPKCEIGKLVVGVEIYEEN